MDEWKGVEVPRYFHKDMGAFACTKETRNAAFEHGYADGIGDIPPSSAGGHPINVVAYDHGWAAGHADREALLEARHKDEMIEAARLR